MHKIIFTLNYLTTKVVEHDMLCGPNTTSLCSINLTLVSVGEGAGHTRKYMVCITIGTSKITVYTSAN